MLLLRLFFLAAHLFGEEGGSETVNEGQRYSYLGEVVNMLITLCVILVLIFLTVWFLKKMMRSRVKTLNRTNGIKILERRVLTQKSSLYLVDVLGKGVVISESAAGLQLITEFPEGIQVSELYEKLQEAQPESIPFSETLSKKLRKLKLGNTG